MALGDLPLEHHSASAGAVRRGPALRPRAAGIAVVDLNERNGRLAWSSDASRKMDFTREDSADDILLNEIIWRSVRGSDSPLPAARHAAIVFAHAGDQDDD